LRVAALGNLHAELGEYFGRGEGAQVVEVAGIVGCLQAEEVELGFTRKRGGVETGGKARLLLPCAMGVCSNAAGASWFIAPGCMPAYCIAGAGALRRMKKRNSINAAIASRASIRKLAISSPSPRWVNSAARPRPAARPAIGPIQELFCGAVVGEAVFCCWRCGVASCLAGALRCMPNDLLPPRRLASASCMTRPKPTKTANRLIKNCFMATPTKLNTDIGCTAAKKFARICGGQY
jgi:hypothetical protein